MHGQRFDLNSAPEGYKAFAGLETYLAKSPLGKQLIDLIKLRVSQINGCAFCIDMHWKELVALGEPANRLYGLCAWREQDIFSDRERAALDWAEALTLISERGAPDALYGRLREHFNEREVADLCIAIATINGWNRLAISARTPPGTFEPKRQARNVV